MDYLVQGKAPFPTKGSQLWSLQSEPAAKTYPMLPPGCDILSASVDLVCGIDLCVRCESSWTSAYACGCHVALYGRHNCNECRGIVKCVWVSSSQGQDNSQTKDTNVDTGTAGTIARSRWNAS